MWLEETLGTRINQNRVDEAVATLGAKGGVIATGCPFCLTMMKDGIADAGVEESVRALDVAELVALGLPKAPGAAGRVAAAAPRRTGPFARATLGSTGRPDAPRR